MGFQSIDLLNTPYKGLMPYSEQDALFFFGREKDWKNIVANLKCSPLTVLYGSGGVGKSSVLRAGVAYNLQQEAKQNLEDYGAPEFAVIVFNSWRDNPLNELVNSIQKSVAQAMEGNLDELTNLVQERVQDHLKLTQILQLWAKLLSGEDVRGKLFIILDQFEEYFLYHSDEEGEGTFFSEFPLAVNHSDVNFLISIREDALAQLDRFKARIMSLFDNYLRIRHLDRKAAEDAIVKPLKEAYNKLVPSEESFDVEPALAEAVLNQISQYVPSEGGLGGIEKVKALQEKQVEASYLQIVMTVLWDEETKSGSHKLRLETLNKLGGADQIVDKYLNDKMESLPREQRYAAAVVFQQLVTPFGTKISYPALELADRIKRSQKQLFSQKQLENLLKKLDAQRIIRSTRASIDDPTIKRYEIFNDKLVQPILKWRQQYLQEQKLEEQQQQLKLINNSTIKQRLPAQSLRQIKFGQDEKAALLARQAYRFYQREPNKVLYQIDEALREALSIQYFSNILQGHTFGELGFSAIAFHPQNSHILASADYNGIILLWDLSRQSNVSQLKKLKDFHTTAEVNALVFSPDGKMLASGGSDGKVWLYWDLDKSDISSRILGYHQENVASVAFNCNGAILASGSDDNTITLWNLENKSETKLIATLREHKKAVRALAFSPNEDNGYLLASGSKDFSVRLWDIRDNSCFEVLTDHSDIVRSVAFSPDGQVLASGSEDKKVILWNLSNLKEIVKIKTLTDHKNGVRSVAFSSDGKWLASGSKDQTIYLWGLNLFDRNNILLKEKLRGHNYSISAVAFSPDNQILASASWDKTIRLWHLYSSDTIPQILGRHLDNIMSVAVSPDSRWLASGSCDNKVRLWDISQPDARPKLLKEYEHEDTVFAVAFDRNSQMLASAGADRTIKLWNLPNLEQSPQELTGHKDVVSSVAFGPDGRWLISGSWKKDATVRLWDLQHPDSTGKIVWKHENSVTSVAFSSDGKMLASGSYDKTIKLLDLRRTEGLSWDSIYEQSSSDSPENSIVHSIVPDERHNFWVLSVAFSPNSKMLASGSADRTIRLWDISQAEEKPNAIKVNKKEHNFWVGSVAFSPDGQKLASGSYDKSIRLWDLKHIDEEPIVLRGHEQSVTSVAFYPDGKKLVSGSYDNTIRSWITDTEILADLVCKKVQRNLTQKEWRWFMGSNMLYERTYPNLPPGEVTSEILQAEEVSELEQEFRDKLANFFPGQRYVLEFIVQRYDQQLDVSEEDVTNLMHKPKGDAGTFYRLETLRLLGFLEITDEGHGYGTIRYGLSPRYREYLSKTKAEHTK